MLWVSQGVQGTASVCRPAAAGSNWIFGISHASCACRGWHQTACSSSPAATSSTLGLNVSTARCEGSYLRPHACIGALLQPAMLDCLSANAWLHRDAGECLCPPAGGTCRSATCTLCSNRQCMKPQSQFCMPREAGACLCVSAGDSLQGQQGPALCASMCTCGVGNTIFCSRGYISSWSLA